jgi:hypothetical protein
MCGFPCARPWGHGHVGRSHGRSFRLTLFGARWLAGRGGWRLKELVEEDGIAVRIDQGDRCRPLEGVGLDGGVQFESCVLKSGLDARTSVNDSSFSIRLVKPGLKVTMLRSNIPWKRPSVLSPFFMIK